MKFIIICLTTLICGYNHAQNQVFFGNLHSHTSYSDGSATPEDAYRHARDVAKVHFLAITEHNHPSAGKIASNPNLYSGPASTSISTAGRFNQDNHFVAIFGQEFSSISSGNHANIFELNEVINSEEVYWSARSGTSGLPLAQPGYCCPVCLSLLHPDPMPRIQATASDGLRTIPGAMTEILAD